MILLQLSSIASLLVSAYHLSPNLPNSHPPFNPNPETQCSAVQRLSDPLPQATRLSLPLRCIPLQLHPPLPLLRNPPVGSSFDDLWSMFLGGSSSKPATPVAGGNKSIQDLDGAPHRRTISRSRRMMGIRICL
ncbi:hypothetical protein BDQ17DRAFT_1377891 [Cyathus striatus]|nr:hypothetical protein BDQ17DRAFT_1377891 [Cyathus striatus]